jgi:hypothetical protein
MSLTSIEQRAEIARCEEARWKAQDNGQVQIAFAKDVKNSLISCYDWGQQLSAAPLALSLIGSCYVAATAPKAQGISLQDVAPSGGFKVIA